MKTRGILILAFAALLLSACSDEGDAAEASASVVSASDLSTTLGAATFSESAEGGVLMELDIDANEVISGGLHAVHIHENGSCEAADSDDDGEAETAGAAGGHYNPTDVGHGTDDGPHVGDSENYNYSFSEDGSASLQVRFPLASLAGENPILKEGGTALIVHAGTDDMVSDPGGNSGSRLACGVITAQ